LRMISARRAREADLDKAFSRVDRAAIYRRFQAHSRADVAPSTAGSTAGMVFQRLSGCAIPGYARAAFAGYRGK
jgi:hypothetical protein